MGLNVVKSTNTATIGAGDTIHAQGVTLSATMADGQPTHNFSAKASSGASAGKVAVAGALAIDIVRENSATASIQGPGTAVEAGGGPVSLTATNTSASTADAEPVNEGATSSGSLGVGASVALNIVPNTTSATIEDGATLTGASDLTLAATGNHTVTTTAVNGAAAKDGTGIGISAAIAIVNNATTATIGTALGAADPDRGTDRDGDPQRRRDDASRRQGGRDERGGDRDWSERGE